MPTSVQRNASQIRTLTHAMGAPRWLGAMSHINGLKQSYTYPGGCDQASWTISQPPQWRTDALDPGRIVEIWRGGSKTWEGILDEPVPGATGWSCTAHGNGTYGSSFLAEYTTWNMDNPIDRAINRGLRWKKPTFGAVGWMQTQQDSAAITITDFLNNATIQAGLLWNVDARQGNLLSIAAPPSVLAPDRILVCTVPSPRTLAAGLTTLWYKYVSAVSGSTQTSTITNVLNASLIAKWGALEQTIDMTAAGLLTSTAAANNAKAVLNQYQSANYTTAFTVWRGQYLTLGGSPIDLGTETAYPHVARLILTDGSYGGEVAQTPVSFVLGAYEYDDDSQTAQITPYQSYKSNLATLLTAQVPGLRQ